MNSRLELTTWYVLHGLLCLSLPTLLFLLSSCIKSPEVKPTQLGPQASEEEMELALSKALYGVDPWKVKKNQQVIYELNARIENQEQVQPISQITQTVLLHEDTGAHLKFVVEDMERDYSSGEINKSERTEEYDRVFNPPTTVAAAVNPLKFISPLSFFNQAFAIKGKSTTYHNLLFSQGQENPPLAVRQRPDCGGVPDCKLSVTRIAYDEVTWHSDREYDIDKWNFVISRNAPYLAYILERCLAGTVFVNGRYYYVRQCQFATDFSYQ